MLQIVHSNEARQLAVATIRICLFVTEQNLALQTPDALMPVLKTSFPDSLTLAKIKLSRTKCGNIIRYSNDLIILNNRSFHYQNVFNQTGICDYITSKLIQKLNSTPWSMDMLEYHEVLVDRDLIMDETVYSDTCLWS